MMAEYVDNSGEEYELAIDGVVVVCGTFGEVLDELCKMRMHGCHFTDVGDSVVILRRK